ncbi:MAG: DUF4838 domain-containing protein [Promethearchaeota archaeon]
MKSRIRLSDLKRIIIPENPSPCEEYAAGELKSHIAQATGLHLDILKQGFPSGAGSIILGEHEGISSESSGIQLNVLGEDGFWLKTEGDCLIIAGSKTRGVLYGTYEFLDQCLGIKFLAPGVIHVPSIDPSIEICISKKYMPAFGYRVITYLDGLDPEFSPTQKTNLNPFAEEEMGGSHKFSPTKMTHTFYSLVPPKKYYKEHPEYFSLVDGKRLEQLGQLCLTNPGTLAVATETVLKWFEEEPEILTVGVVQNDWTNYCTCDACRAVDRGNPARSLILFCKHIATKVKERYPDKFIHTIAYTYTEIPPMDMKDEIPDNLIITICNMYPYRSNRPMDRDPMNRRYYENLKGWLEIAPHVFTWHYFVDFTHYLLPYPIWKTIASDLKTYRQLGVEGVLLQAGIGLGLYQEFQELKMFVFHKLLWNPDLDLDSLIKEFVVPYYGPASEHVLSFIYNMSALEEREDVVLHLYIGLEGNHLHKNWVMENMAIIEEALEVVKDDEILKERVEKIMMMLDYAYLIFPVEYHVLLGKIKPKDLDLRKKIFARFSSLVLKFKITTPGENAPMSAFLDRQELICRENSVLAIAELAPLVMSIMNDVFEKVSSHVDDNGLFKPNDFITTTIKHGLNPVELNPWLSEKQIGTLVPSVPDIWHKKLEKANVNGLLHPSHPIISKGDLPGIVLGMLKGLPDQKDTLLDD